MASKEKVVRDIVWSGTKTLSLDYCCIKREREGWRFSGMIVAKFHTNPFGAHYEILVDKTFKPRRLVVEKIDAVKAIRLEIEFRDGIWTVDGKRRADLRECTDVDLEASPVTNTLPIKRTRLGIGQKVDMTEVWVRFPSLRVERLQQSYERLSARKYVYHSASGFSAELEVDSFGSVTSYDDIWKRV